MIEEIIEEIQVESEDITENNQFEEETASGNILDEENTGTGEMIENEESQEIVEEIPQTIQNITYSGGLVNIDDSKNFIYDNNGNIVSNGTYNFIYDYKNRIIEVTNGSGTVAQYAYDVLDRRYKKESQNKTITYIFANENILGESIDDGVNIVGKDYINGLGTDNLIAYEVDDVRFYFHKNHLGSIDGITDNSGNRVIEYEYDSFGNTYVVESGELIDINDFSGDIFENERLYTSREFDFEVGLYYNRARYYSPEIGRFISRDPIDIADDINLYAYVGNNPVMFVDLMGQKAKDAFVKAYDEYLYIEKLIYNFGVFDTRFLMLDTNLRKDLLVQYDKAEAKAKELHYARNDYNTITPEKLGDLDPTNWSELTLLQSWYHQNTAESLLKANKKFISKDGKNEVIYNEKGFKVTNIEDIGTYNFFHPVSESSLHTKYDVSPYWKWGNGPNDTTNFSDRLLGF